MTEKREKISGCHILCRLILQVRPLFKARRHREMVEARPGYRHSQAFFREIPLIMMGQIARAFALEDEVPDCAVWKVIGDEIVFMARPRTARETQLLVIAFYRMVINYDQKIFGRWPLRIKGLLLGGPDFRP